jgi:hypothetical protein
MQSISDPTETLDATLGMATGLADTMSKHFKEVAIEMAGMSFDEFDRRAEFVGELIEARTLDRVVEIEANYLKCAHRAFSQRILRLLDLYAAIGQDMTKPIAGTHFSGIA